MWRFPSHTELRMYLRDFCEHFGLGEMIRFNTRVDYVGMLDYGVCSNDLKWVVRSEDKKSEKTVEEVFDAVVVATGHYSQPRLPSIQGKSNSDTLDLYLTIGYTYNFSIHLFHARE